MSLDAVVQPVEVVGNDDMSHQILPSVNPRRRRRASSKPAPKKARVIVVKQDAAEPVDMSPPHTESACGTSSSTVLHIDELTQCRIYEEQLLRYDGISRLGGNNAFLLQDFDVEKKSLKEKFLLVQSRWLKDSDGTVLVYACQCDPAREQLVMSLSPIIEDSWNDATSYKEDCIHIKAMKSLLKANPEAVEEYDEDCQQKDHCYGKKNEEIEVYGVSSSDHILVVRVDKSFTILKIKFNPDSKLHCQACHITTCRHVTIALENIEQFPTVKEILDLNQKRRTKYVPACLSIQAIPFERTDNAPNVNMGIPDQSGKCVCGSSWSESLVFSHDADVFSDVSSHTLKVFDRKCKSCDGLKQYDGGEDEIINMGSYLIKHKVFRTYMRQFLTDGTTLMSFYKQWTWQQAENGASNFNDACSYYRFRHAWYAFLELLDINYVEGFHCPECGVTPSTVIMDGVTLGLRKEYLNWQLPEASSSQLDGSHNERVFVPGQSCRKKLMRFSTIGLATSQDFQDLKKEVSIYCPALLPFINECEENNEISKCPKLFANVLKNLATPYPVSSLVPLNTQILTIIENESKNGNFRKNVKMSLHLEEKVPILFNILSKFDETPQFFKPILSRLVECVRKFENVKEHELKIEGATEETSRHEFFPTLPKVNRRGSYVLDSKTTQSQGQCKKQSGGHPSLSPGLFTMSCQHGVCYGFSLMERAESPNVPFTLLRTRFKKAPAVVVYDNACNLNVYCLNRDPGFFRDTLFLVDRFHWPNHKGCHEGYNMTKFKKFHKLNSQVAEQRNSTLKCLRSVLSYMDLKNFMNHCKIFIWFRTNVTLASMREGNINQYSSFFKKLSAIYSSL